VDQDLNRTEPDSEGLRLAAERFLATGALDRSVPLHRLFQFLLACTLEGRLPRETDVAADLFGSESGFETSQDATVRVHVHRLRRKLEEFRLSYPDEAAFLSIPRGDYRLVLHRRTSAQGAPLGALPHAAASASPAGRRLWVLALAGLLIVNITGWALVGMRDHRPGEAQALEKATFWAGMARSSRPTVVVVGDYYIVGEAANGMEVTRLVREFSINSRDDLDEYLMFHPEKIGRLVDLNLHYLPVGAASALRSLMPMIDDLERHGHVRVITMSQLTPQILKGSNVIYIGFLSGLGMLRDVVFEQSSLAVGESYDELVDTKSKKRFLSDWADVASGRTSQRDYGYLANFVLPGGQQLVVIAGMRDAALSQAAESAADPGMLAEIQRRTRGAHSTESLLEVSTLGNAALTGRLVLARPLAPAMRDNGAPAKLDSFPDEVRAVP